MANAVTFALDTVVFAQRVQRFVHGMDREATEAVKRVAEAVFNDTRAGWPVGPDRQGHPHSRDLWSGPIRVGTQGFQISNSASYAGIIEYGGYRGPGPKTHRFGPVTLGQTGVTIGAGIYPRQVPAAPLRRALAKHWGAMTAQMHNALRRTWGR